MTIKYVISSVITAVFLLGSTSMVYAKTGEVKTEASAQAAKVSLNKGDAKALMQVKGMSAYKAHSIVAYRKQHGDFKSVDELQNVKGFKRMKPENRKNLTDQLLLD